MNKIIICFCEGQHDIAFLSKLLFAHGFKEYEKKLEAFEEPFGEQFITLLRTTVISDRKLGFQPTNHKISSVSISKDETLILFHNISGDGNKVARKEVLEMYKNLKGDDDFSKYEFNFRFLYFFDADTNTVQSRINDINTELSLSNTLSQGTVVNNKEEYGCYIFHKDLNGGLLEDLLLELMTPDNEDYFQNSHNFIKDNTIDFSRQKEYKCFSGTYGTSVKFKEKKSIISIAGQLQFSGMNNSVIIAKSDFIKKNDILNNTNCEDIIKLFL